MLAITTFFNTKWHGTGVHQAGLTTSLAGGHIAVGSATENLFGFSAEVVPDKPHWWSPPVALPSDLAAFAALHPGDVLNPLLLFGQFLENAGDSSSLAGAVPFTDQVTLNDLFGYAHTLSDEIGYAYAFQASVLDGIEDDGVATFATIQELIASVPGTGSRSATTTPRAS